MTHQRIEGRQHAVQCLRSVFNQSSAWFDARGALGTVIANLSETAQRYPAEYANGIRDVISELRGVAG